MAVLSAYSTDVRYSRTELRQIPTPAPLGQRHRPVPFAEYVDLTENALNRTGLRVIGEEHLVGHEGQRYFGALEIAPLEGELITAKEWSMFVALRGSHDQSVPRGIALGRHVMVCSNLCFSGDIATLSTKQTTNIWSRLPGMVYGAVSRVPELAALEERRVERMIGFEMKPRWGDAALVEIFRRGGLSGAQLTRAIGEWDRPSFEEHAEGYNAWRLEQAVTQAVKPTGQVTNIFNVQDRTRRASEFINEMIDFVTE